MEFESQIIGSERTEAPGQVNGHARRAQRPLRAGASRASRGRGRVPHEVRELLRHRQAGRAPPASTLAAGIAAAPAAFASALAFGL